MPTLHTCLLFHDNRNPMWWFSRNFIIQRISNIYASTFDILNTTEKCLRGLQFIQYTPGQDQVPQNLFQNNVAINTWSRRSVLHLAWNNETKIIEEIQCIQVLPSPPPTPLCICIFILIQTTLMVMFWVSVHRFFMTRCHNLNHVLNIYQTGPIRKPNLLLHDFVYIRFTQTPFNK